MTFRKMTFSFEATSDSKRIFVFIPTSLMLNPSCELHHPIKVVCQRTGLTAHAIRVWERRYGLICCQRTDSNRRLYSDEEIERLKLLKILTDGGHRISKIFCHSLDKLSQLHQEQLLQSSLSAPICTSHETPEKCLSLCLNAVQQMETVELSTFLEEARIRYGTRITLLRVITPLVHETTEASRRGHLRITHEHFVTNAVRDFIALGARCRTQKPNAPEILLSNPLGESREVGAFLATAIARDLGWRATYLGPSLPAEEIAFCAQTRKAYAVGLGITHPADDAVVLAELKKLRQLLPSSIYLLIGGPAALPFFEALNDPEIKLVSCLPELESILAEMIQPRVAA